MKVRLMMFALLGFAAVGCGSVGEDGTTYAWETTTTAFDIDEVVLDTVWSEQSLSERRALCADVEQFGPTGAARIVVSEAPSFSVSQVAAKLTEWCL